MRTLKKRWMQFIGLTTMLAGREAAIKNCIFAIDCVHRKINEVPERDVSEISFFCVSAVQPAPLRLGVIPGLIRSCSLGLARWCGSQASHHLTCRDSARGL